MQHEYGVIGCSGHQRHSAIEVSVDQVVHRGIRVSGIVGNLKTWEDRGTHLDLVRFNFLLLILHIILLLLYVSEFLLA